MEGSSNLLSKQGSLENKSNLSQTARRLIGNSDPETFPSELRELYASLHSLKPPPSSDHIATTVPSPLASPSSNRRGPSDENSVGDSVEEESGERKKKLTKKQVNELEELFQGGYTGAPEGRTLISQRMGISTRQVAIWFQNRRARQRSKQLHSDFDMLKQDFRLIFLENQAMRKELQELRARFCPQAERDPSSLPPPQPPGGAGPSQLQAKSPPPLKMATTPNDQNPNRRQEGGLQESHQGQKRGEREDLLTRVKRARLNDTGGGSSGESLAHHDVSQLGKRSQSQGALLSLQPTSSGLLESAVAQRLFEMESERLRGADGLHLDTSRGLLAAGPGVPNCGFEQLDPGPIADKQRRAAPMSFFARLGDSSAQMDLLAGLQGDSQP